MAGDAAAICTWAPSLVVTTVTGLESHGFDLSYTGVPTGPLAPPDCLGFGIHHYRAVLKQGSAPTDETDGLIFDGSTGTTLRAMPHRASRSYYVRLFACDDATCTDIFGDGVVESISTVAGLDDQDTGTTEDEEWLIDDKLSTQTGLGSTAVDDLANDVEVLTIPQGWTGAGKLAIFAFDHDDTERSVSVALSSGTGWTNYNSTTWSGFTNVVGSNSTLPDYAVVNHPFVIPHDDGTTKRFRMMAQNAGAAGTQHQVWVDSAAGTPQDFDLTLTGTDCVGTSDYECDWATRVAAGLAGVALESGTVWETNLHGRWVWDYVADGVPDLTSDSPLMVFTGQPDGTNCVDVGDDSSDIYMATWSPGTSTWVPYDGVDSGTCADAIVPDAHDPAVTPLPAGEFKMYSVNTNDHDIIIHYYDGTKWESDTATVTVRWDDAASPQTPVDQDCIANVATVARMVSGTGREAMFMYVARKDTDFEEQVCDAGSDFTGAGSRIYAAELQN